MTRPQETFTDMLARLFPMPGIQLGINSPHSKCITFQVTGRLQPALQLLLSGLQDAPEDVA